MTNKSLLKIATMFAASAFIAGTAQANYAQIGTQPGVGTDPALEPRPAAGVGPTDEAATTPQADVPSDTQAETTTDETRPVDLYATTDMSMEEVSRLQEELNSELGTNLQTDGIFGPFTQSALMQYQEQNNLQATGRPDQETLNSLGIDASTEAVERRPAAVESMPESEPQMESDSQMNTEAPEAVETIPTETEVEQEGMEQQQESIDDDLEQQDGALYEEDVEVQQESVNSEMLNDETDTN